MLTIGCPGVMRPASASKTSDIMVLSLGLPWPLPSSANKTTPMQVMSSLEAKRWALMFSSKASVAVVVEQSCENLAASFGLGSLDTARLASAVLKSASTRRRFVRPLSPRMSRRGSELSMVFTLAWMKKCGLSNKTIPQRSDCSAGLTQQHVFEQTQRTHPTWTTQC